jgi:hypothetical protein
MIAKKSVAHRLGRALDFGDTVTLRGYDGPTRLALPV